MVKRVEVYEELYSLYIKTLSVNMSVDDNTVQGVPTDEVIIAAIKS